MPDTPERTDNLQGPHLPRINPRTLALSLTVTAIVLTVVFSLFMIEFLRNAH